jgi:predicted nucleic acid-binding Zn finger protein
MVRGELYQIDDEGGNILRFTNCEKRTVSLVTFWWGEGKKCTCPDFRFNRKAKAHGCKHILACDEILRKYL